MLDTSKINSQVKTLVFVDSQVDDYKSLIEGVTVGAEAIVLESDRDGIEAISAELHKYASRNIKIDALHIISHGSAGSLQLGNAFLNRHTLEKYRSRLRSWQQALTSTADILLYGCNLAAGIGAVFVKQLSELTGAKIAASINLTGNEAKSGDWNLSFTTGEIKASIALVPEVIATYDGVLATFTVTNTNDDGIGSLRDAIANAQSGDTIKFDSSLANQTITLTSSQLTVDKDLTIDAGDAANLTISGNNQFRVFDVQRAPGASTASFTLKNAIVANGKTFETGEAGAGGGIRTANFTTLVVENSEFKNNVAGGEGGGGIFAGWQGDTTVINSKFDNNDGTPDKAERGGGAIATKSAGTLTVRNSEFTNNKGINGGAINSLLGELTVEDSTFINNEAITPTTKTPWFGLGGAILTDGANASGPGYTPGSEGGQIVIRNSHFEGNKAFEGGATNLYAYSPDLVVVEDSSFVSNTAIKKSDNTAGNGGGIWHGGSEFTISNTTFSDNLAETQGGALWVDKISPTDITNSTFSGNRAEDPASEDGIGGAMIMNSTAQIINTTIANNYAKNHSGAIFNSPSTPGQITLSNTIFDNNSVGNQWNTLKHTNRELIDGGNNIQFPDKEPNNDINVTANITIADPKLGALEEINGRLVHPLLEGSVAIDAGKSSGAPSTDQLGESRVGQVDIGAYEFSAPPSTVGKKLLGGSDADNLDGTQGEDTLLGRAGNDILNAGDGNDILRGGEGADTMNGGAGDDIYAVNSVNDVVNESPGEGTDIIQSNVSYTLPVNVENLNLTGNNSIDGTGNDSNNILIGNNSNNVLNGGLGNDTFIGHNGDDVLNGEDGDDILNGDDGNDTLSGDAGADTMNGGMGNDVYVVDDVNDAINEGVAAGTDTVKSSVTFSLRPNLENLELTGNIVINGIGNGEDNNIVGNDANNVLKGWAGNDTLMGNQGKDTVVGHNGDDVLNGGDGSDILNGHSGNDTLSGDAGADTMNGGQGNDIYVVDNVNDAINEVVAAGTDTVQSSVTFFLRPNLENLELTGSSAIHGVGNDEDNNIVGNDGNNILKGGVGNDTLTGNAGNDILNAGTGNDSLTGGLGSDRFVYRTGSSFTSADVGEDIIADFSRSDTDKIILSKRTFDSLTSIAAGSFSVANEFESVTDDGTAATSNAFIVYNSSNGKLFYNPNGNVDGFGSGGLFATLSNTVPLAAGDFTLQS